MAAKIDGSSRPATAPAIGGGLNPFINPWASPPSAGAQTPDILTRLQGYIRSWFVSTESMRRQMRRDYEYVDAGGKQWTDFDRNKVLASGRPVLEFNQILPQVELMAGLQRSSQSDVVFTPRGRNDKRLVEIADTSVRAAREFTRINRVRDKVFDDATICGLGAMALIHTIEDPQDLIWGDIVGTRINPLAFMWDPWCANSGDMQDGAFMGYAYWMQLDEYRERFPQWSHYAVPGEWLATHGLYAGDSTSLGTPPNLLFELYDQVAGRIRVLNLWWKEEATLNVIVNAKTGQVQEVPSKKAGEDLLRELARRHGSKAIQGMGVQQMDNESAIVDKMSGRTLLDPTTGQPMVFADPNAGQMVLDKLADRAGMEIYQTMGLVTRRVRVPKFAELVWWAILNDSGEGQKTPFNDRDYPFLVYTSRKFSDDPESIKGIVRDLRDPQDEYNKRYSNLLAHLNSTAHSGWLNKKAGGANPDELKKMGSMPGVVVEFSTVAPQQIHPVAISEGHVALLNNSERQILRISGLNAEIVGMTTQTTVSGKAIQSRQQGGLTIIKPRMTNYEEFERDLAAMLLRRIQQFYPVEKIKRIIDIVMMQTPQGPQPSIWTDPLTGGPATDEQIIQFLKDFKNTEFDVTMQIQSEAASERQQRFEKAVQIMSLYGSTGHPIGPRTMQALIDMADMPTQLEKAMLEDLAQPPNPALAAQQGEQLNKTMNQVRGGRAGGNEGQLGGGRPGGE